MKKVVPKNELDINFPSLLRSLRIKAGLSQGDVQKALGYRSSQFISNWERALAMPPAEVFAKLADLYKIPLDSFIEIYIQYRVQGLENEIRSKFSKPAIKIAA